MWPVARVILALGLIALLLWRVDLRQVLELVRSCRAGFVALGAGLYLLLLVICTARWQVLLRAQGRRFSAWFLFRVYLASAAMNAVLPTALGGDVLRVILTADRDVAAGAVSVVLVDRLLGLIALLLLVLGASVWLLAAGGWGGFALLSAAGLALLGLLSAAVMWDGPYRRLAGLLGRLKFLGLGVKVLGVAAGIRNLRRHGRAVVLAGLLSFGVWVVHCLVWFVLGLAVGTRTPVGVYFVVAPVVALATMLPVSVGGVGIRENGFVLLMAGMGMAEATAGGIALLFLALTYGYALTGGLFLVGLRRKRPGQPVQNPRLSG